MPRGYRRYLPAIGLVAFALIAFGFADFLVRRAAHLEALYEKQANGEARAYSDRADVAIERRCRALPAANQFQCIREEREAARQGAHNVRGVEAQALSTIWTKYTDIAVIFGTAAGAIGLLLILATFWQNKRSADAQHDANRPWIDIAVVEMPEFQIREGQAIVQLVLKLTNRGNSPATGVTAITQLVGVPPADGIVGDPGIQGIEKIFDRWAGHKKFGTTVFPSTDSPPQKHVAKFTPEEWVQACNGVVRPVIFYLGVGAQYEVAGRTARTVYSYILLDVASPMMMIPPDDIDLKGARLRVDQGHGSYAT